MLNPILGHQSTPISPQIRIAANLFHSNVPPNRLADTRQYLAETWHRRSYWRNTVVACDPNFRAADLSAGVVACG